MAFQSKTDYCGLVAATTPSGGTSPLTIRDSNLNGKNEKYQPQGQDGSFLATEVYGQDTSPSNSYGLAAALTTTAGQLKLGKINAITVGEVTTNYALESIDITTGAAAAPSISATCQEVESSASDASMCHYDLPVLSLTTKQHAQILFSAFSLTGSGCSLTQCSASISCTVNKDKVAGVKIASDINSGVITVSGTVIQTGDTAPTISVEQNSGWVITKLIAPTESNGETTYKTYTFEVQKILAKASV